MNPLQNMAGIVSAKLKLKWADARGRTVSNILYDCTSFCIKQMH